MGFSKKDTPFRTWLGIITKIENDQNPGSVIQNFLEKLHKSVQKVPVSIIICIGYRKDHPILNNNEYVQKLGTIFTEWINTRKLPWGFGLIPSMAHIQMPCTTFSRPNYIWISTSYGCVLNNTSKYIIKMNVDDILPEITDNENNWVQKGIESIESMSKLVGLEGYSFGYYPLSKNLNMYMIGYQHHNIFGSFIPYRISKDWLDWSTYETYYRIVNDDKILPPWTGSIPNNDINKIGDGVPTLNYESDEEAWLVVNSKVKQFYKFIEKQKRKLTKKKKIISYCLWGDNPKYCEGAIRNAIINKQLFPTWINRFYIAKGTVPQHYIDTMKSFENVEIVEMDRDGNQLSTLWRFAPAYEDDVEVMMSRDCDSRIGLRDKEAIDEWMKSKRLVHIIRDHPHHTDKILAGLWGIKQGAVDAHALKEIFEQPLTEKDNYYTIDQKILENELYPLITHTLMVHDEFSFTDTPIESALRIFPSRRRRKEYCGDVYDIPTEGVKLNDHFRKIPQEFELRLPDNDYDVGLWYEKHNQLKYAIQYFKRFIKQHDKNDLNDNNTDCTDIIKKCYEKIVEIYSRDDYPVVKSEEVINKYRRYIS